MAWCGSASTGNGRRAKVNARSFGKAFCISCCAGLAANPNDRLREVTMDLGLAGSTAVVTGGSKGMGLAIAETLAAEGASVAVMARGAEALDAAVASLRDAGAPDAVGNSVDMADAESIAAGFAAIAERWGRLNCLVHTIGPG